MRRFSLIKEDWVCLATSFISCSCQSPTQLKSSFPPPTCTTQDSAQGRGCCCTAVLPPKLGGVSSLSAAVNTFFLSFCWHKVQGSCSPSSWLCIWFSQGSCSPFKWLCTWFSVALFKGLGNCAEKRLRMMTSSILLQSEGKASGPVKKKVTFDPNLSQTDKEGTTKIFHPSTKALTLKETADIVVKYLTPFYKGGKFASKVGYEPYFVFQLELLQSIKSKWQHGKKYPHCWPGSCDSCRAGSNWLEKQLTSL